MANTALAVAEKRYGLAEQAQFGTGIGAASAFSQLQVEHFSLTDDLKRVDIPMSNGVRYGILDNTIINTAEAMPTFSFTVPRVTADSLDQLCYGWFQNVAEGATAAAFSKTFTLPVAGATQQPDFSAHGGFFFAFCEREPTASTSKVIDDCIVSSLTISGEPSGYLSAAAECVGRGGAASTFNPSGTWTLDSARGWHYSKIATHTIDFNDGNGAQAMALRGGWEINLTQTVVPTDFKAISLRGGTAASFGQYGLVDRGGTFTIRCQTDALTQTALTNSRAGTQVDVNFYWSENSALNPGMTDDDLSIAFTGKLTTTPVIEGDDIMTTVLTGDIVADSTAVTPITIIMTNATDRSW